MVQPCDAAKVVTGFANMPFGAIVCEGIADVLAKIPADVQVKIGTPADGGNVKLNIAGMASADTPPTDGTAHERNLVTVKYLNEFFKTRSTPRVEVGIVQNVVGGVKVVKFKKPFDKTPIVIAQPVGVSFVSGCKQDKWELNTIPQNVNKNGFTVTMPKKDACG